MIHVSIAEDLPEIRQGLELMIENQPDMVLSSSSINGMEAAIAILATQPDVVIMDIDMPEMNGIECIKQIASKCRNYKSILCYLPMPILAPNQLFYIL